MKITMLGGLLFLALGTGDRFKERSLIQLKEEEMWVEFTAHKNEAAIVMHAETESRLGQIEILDPNGLPVARIWSQDQHGMAVSGFVLETVETTPEQLFQTYPEGVYGMRGSTVDGLQLEGGARLSHVMPAIPRNIHPMDGAVGVPTTVTVTWEGDRRARGYRIVVEQDENDGLVVELPASAHSFQVPEGVLKPGTPTVLEVGVIGDNLNTTVVEVNFTT